MPPQVINWPPNGSTIIRISLGKSKEISSVSSQRNYVIETTAENLWSKKISRIGFNLYLAVGKHNLEFMKEGFNPGKFPVEIGPDRLWRKRQL